MSTLPPAGYSVSSFSESRPPDGVFDFIVPGMYRFSAAPVSLGISDSFDIRPIPAEPMQAQQP